MSTPPPRLDRPLTPPTPKYQHLQDDDHDNDKPHYYKDTTASLFASPVMKKSYSTIGVAPPTPAKTPARGKKELKPKHHHHKSSLSITSSSTTNRVLFAHQDQDHPNKSPPSNFKDGMWYVFRGKRIFRPFPPNHHDHITPKILFPSSPDESLLDKFASNNNNHDEEDPKFYIHNDSDLETVVGQDDQED